MLTTAGIMMIGVLFDIAVVYYAGGLELFDDEKAEPLNFPKRSCGLVLSTTLR